MLLVKKNKVTHLFRKYKVKLNTPYNSLFELKNIKNRIAFYNKSKNADSKYLFLPLFFQVKLINHTFEVLFLNNKRNYTFYNFFIRFLTQTQITYQQLILKGSGFKISFLSKLNQLELKLGFTHKKYIFIPTQSKLNVVLQKPMLVALDYNRARLGNFIKSIKNTREINVYSGRGFWDFKKQQKLKAIKKQ